MLTKISGINEKDDTILISVGNVKSSIVASSDIREKLASAFGYEVEDADYIRDAKIKFYQKENRPKDAKKWAKWDGKFSVFDYSKTTFGTGILSDVMMYLEDEGYEVEIIDKTRRPVFNFGRFNAKNKKTLFDYQNDAFKRIIKNDGRGIIHASVAFGKTILAMKVIDYYSTITIIVVDRVEIMKQWIEQIDDWFELVGEKLKGVSGKIWYMKEQPAILLCTSRLLSSVFDKRKTSKTMIQRNNLVKKMAQNSGLLIYDEVHHASAKNARKAITNVRAFHRIGLSGTVGMRDDNSDYEYLAIIGNVIYEFTPTALVNNKRGAEINIKILDVKYENDFIRSCTQTRNYQSLYDMFIVENEKRNMAILMTTLEEVEKGNSVLVLVDRIIHARQLSAMLGDDIATFTWSSDDKKKRNEKIASFKNGEIPALFCTYALAGEGFDYPELNVLIMAGGKSEIKIRQSIGRIMRKKKDNSNAILYDFADSINPFRDHFLNRLDIYNSEEVFVIKEMPLWVKRYV